VSTIALAMLASLPAPGIRAQGAELPKALDYASARLLRDRIAMEAYRPSYPFWRHIFTIPDGSILFGSAVDGRLLVTAPSNGDWGTEANWQDPALPQAVEGQAWPRRLDDRRALMAEQLSLAIGPVVHNPSRGISLLSSASRFGPFINEWRAIYERFAVPGDIGLAQAVVESGLRGTVKSEARAIGFCQFLLSNWRALDRLSPVVLEAENQTTQAPYCAAYLTVLATKYGSYIPALSEHHAGGANIGRTLINGERLGGLDVREQYFLGAAFARDLRVLSPGTYSDVYGTYGPRSSLYSEMVFGNTITVSNIANEQTPQEKIYAMRTSRAWTLAEIARTARLSRDEVQRFNPALARRVPRGATVYLPRHIPAIGSDVAFWHRPAPESYQALIDEFVSLEMPLDDWDAAPFDATLRRFQTRFAATKTEEGSVMATMLAYELQIRQTSKQREILAEFRESDRIRQLFDRARRERDAYLAASGGRTLGTATD
jgi:hypothetical protein